MLEKHLPPKDEPTMDVATLDKLTSALTKNSARRYGATPYRTAVLSVWLATVGT